MKKDQKKIVRKESETSLSIAFLKPEKIVEKRSEKLSIEIIRICHEHQSDHKTKINLKKMLSAINLKSVYLEYNNSLLTRHKKKTENPRRGLVLQIFNASDRRWWEKERRGVDLKEICLITRHSKLWFQLIIKHDFQVEKLHKQWFLSKVNP